MEFVTQGLDFPEAPGPRDNRGLMVYGRAVGGEDEVTLSSLSSLINRRNYSLHLCGGDPCR